MFSLGMAGKQALGRLRNLLRFAAVGGLALLLVGCGADAPASSTPLQPIRDPWQWADEFGGAPAGYTEILRSVDCAGLQANFDNIASVIESETKRSSTRSRARRVGSAEVVAGGDRQSTPRTG